MGHAGMRNAWQNRRSLSHDHWEFAYQCRLPACSIHRREHPSLCPHRSTFRLTGAPLRRQHLGDRRRPLGGILPGPTVRLRQGRRPLRRLRGHDCDSGEPARLDGEHGHQDRVGEHQEQEARQELPPRRLPDVEQYPTIPSPRWYSDVWRVVSVNELTHRALPPVDVLAGDALPGVGHLGEGHRLGAIARRGAVGTDDDAVRAVAQRGRITMPCSSRSPRNRGRRPQPTTSARNIVRVAAVPGKPNPAASRTALWPPSQPTR